MVDVEQNMFWSASGAQLFVLTHSDGHSTLSLTSMSMPGPASVNMFRRITSVLESSQLHWGVVEVRPWMVSTVMAESTLLHPATPFMPAWLVGCASNTTRIEFPSSAKYASMIAGVCRPLKKKGTAGTETSRPKSAPLSDNLTGTPSGMSGPHVFMQTTSVSV